MGSIKVGITEVAPGVASDDFLASVESSSCLEDGYRRKRCGDVTLRNGRTDFVVKLLNRSDAPVGVQRKPIFTPPPMVLASRRRGRGAALRRRLATILTLGLRWRQHGRSAAEGDRRSFPSEIAVRRRPEGDVLRKPQPKAFVPDEVLGPASFELLSMLGKGAFGSVYQAKHLRSGKAFAVKVIDKHLVQQKNVVMRYTLRERQVMAGLRHPFLVRLHFAFQTRTTLVLVMQLATGGTLSQRIWKEETLSEGTTRMYSAECLLALEFLHARQVAYRDLKPENVVLDDEQHAMLTDFGLARPDISPKNDCKSFCGSVAYLAPEMVSRQGHGLAIDIYGLGVLAFEMLAGHPPFYIRNREILFQRIKAMPLGEVIRRARVDRRASPSGVRFVTDCMARAPAARPAFDDTCNLKEHAWFAGVVWEAVMKKQVPIPGPLPPGFILRDESGGVLSIENVDWLPQSRTQERPRKLVSPWRAERGFQGLLRSMKRLPPLPDVEGWEYGTGPSCMAKRRGTRLRRCLRFLRCALAPQQFKTTPASR